MGDQGEGDQGEGWQGQGDQGEGDLGEGGREQSDQGDGDAGQEGDQREGKGSEGRRKHDQVVSSYTFRICKTIKYNSALVQNVEILYFLSH